MCYLIQHERHLGKSLENMLFVASCPNFGPSNPGYSMNFDLSILMLGDQTKTGAIFGYLGLSTLNL